MTKEIKQKANKVEPMHYLICERYQKDALHHSFWLRAEFLYTNQPYIVIIVT